MALPIGIVGLPNVGKSTTFNALTKAQNAEAANYPFCTIEPNKAIVAVPDPRLDKLAELVDHDSVTYATIEFVDIAGLVKGASHGEGLGNQFLGNIRDVAAIVHVVRCFDDDNVIHVQAHPEPRNDIEVVAYELMMSDLQQLERKIEKLSREIKGDKKLVPVLELAHELQAMLERGEPVSAYPHLDSDAYRLLNHEMRFLSAKPVIYVANVDEAGLAKDNAYVREVRAVAAEQGAAVVKLWAKLEEEMIGMSDEERHEFLELAGAEESGLEQLIHVGFRALGLISFFTTDSKMLRAWNIRQGATGPQAAGVIHTDFERGFIRAEVIHFDDFVQYGSEAQAKAHGALHIEGKEYVVQDADVIHFRFNV
jgi:GTP-binding protein YchF